MKDYLNAIVEVDVIGVIKVSGELKINSPGNKKGATIELRKLSAFEYTNVQFLGNIIKSLLDRFIAVGTIPQATKNVKVNPVKPAITLKTNPKLFECSSFSWETRFRSSLKDHVKRINCQDDKFKCELCILIFNNKLALQEHAATIHKQNNKRPIEVTSLSSSPPHKKFDNIEQIF